MMRVVFGRRVSLIIEGFFYPGGKSMNKHLLCEVCGELVDECLCEEMLDQLEEDDEDVYMEELLVSVEEQVENDMMGKKEEV